MYLGGNDMSWSEDEVTSKKSWWKKRCEKKRLEKIEKEHVKNLRQKIARDAFKQMIESYFG